jgi:subtilisin family serine protease
MRKIIGIVIVMLLITTVSLQVSATQKNIFTRINVTNAIPDDPYFDLQWNLHNTGQSNPYSGEGTMDCDIDAPEAWEIETGETDVIIAIIDCGIDYTHPDLEDNIWINEDEISDNGIDDDNNGFIDDIRGWNFFDDNNDLLDQGGHGTAHAGVAAAVGNNGIGISGVAWNCKIMPIHCVDEFDYGTSEDISEGIRYAVDNGARVISMSFGKYEEYGNEVREAIEYADNANVVLVAAAGNDGYDLKLYPAGYEQVIAVGGTDNKDNKMDCRRFGLNFISNYGDWVDVAAASVDIYLTLPTYSVSYNDLIGVKQDYDYMSGTSFSGPQVAGLAGLLLSKNPTLESDQIKAIICDNVDPYHSDTYIGTGRINAAKALASCNSPNTPTIVGESSIQAGEEYVYTIMTIDTDGHEVTYCIDWGDNSNQEFIGPNPSGEYIDVSHTWQDKGDYTIRVKASDVYGLESDWVILKITVPKQKNGDMFNLWIVRLLEHFPILEHLLVS